MLIHCKKCNSKNSVTEVQELEDIEGFKDRILIIGICKVCDKEIAMLVETRKEDDKLNQAVSLYGNNNWKIVSDMVGTRNRTQCAQRWMRVLNPKLSFESWTADEDQKLLAIVKEYGVKNWIKIAKKKGNRSDVQCRNRYNQIIQG